jgi:hypothetical protein
MELKLERNLKGVQATLGTLFINNEKECNTLEDVDRGIIQDTPLEVITSTKVQNKTAIPTGRYEVIIDFSNRFQKDMPHVLDVPGFEGIRIHPGNSDVDTDGCILLGSWSGSSADWISGSQDAFHTFLPKLEQGLSEGQVFITIT